MKVRSRTHLILRRSCLFGQGYGSGNGARSAFKFLWKIVIFLLVSQLESQLVSHAVSHGSCSTFVGTYAHSDTQLQISDTWDTTVSHRWHYIGTQVTLQCLKMNSSFAKRGLEDDFIIYMTISKLFPWF